MADLSVVVNHIRANEFGGRRKGFGSLLKGRKLDTWNLMIIQLIIA